MINALFFKGKKVNVLSDNGVSERDNNTRIVEEVKLENECELVNGKLKKKKKAKKGKKSIYFLSIIAMLVGIIGTIVLAHFMEYLTFAFPVVLDFVLGFSSFIDNMYERKAINSQIAYLEDYLEEIKAKQAEVARSKSATVSLENDVTTFYKHNDDARLSLNRRLELLRLLSWDRRRYEKLNSNRQLQNELYENYSSEDISFASRVLTNKKYK